MKPIPGLRQRANGTWQYRRVVGKHPDGRPRNRSASWPAGTSATALARAIRKVNAQWDEEAAATAEMEGTLGQLVTDWLKKKGDEHSPTTTYRYRSILTAITTDLGAIKLDKLTAFEIDLWYKQLADRGLSNNTVRQYHRVLRGILQQGVKWKRVAHNEAVNAEPPKPTKPNQADRMPTMAAIKLMLDRANRSVKMAVLLAAATGCRRGELVGLLWSDIDRGVLTIQRSLYKVPGGKLGTKPPKTEEPRDVPLNTSLYLALLRFRTESIAWCESVGAELAEDGPILAHLRKDPTGRTPFAPDWLSQEWERLCTRAGVAPFKLHGTRHLHITSLHDAGSTSAAIANRVGHASIETTEKHYTHALPAATLELARTVETVFAPLFAPAEIAQV